MAQIIDLIIKTEKEKQVIDLTDKVGSFVEAKHFMCSLFVAHTTCGVTTADLDPGTDLDLLDAVWEMIPKLKYRHPHNPAHVPAHLASAIIGPQVSVPVRAGNLILGVWQRLILVELDGPQTRNLYLTLSE